jgi:hypothetical protein
MDHTIGKRMAQQQTMSTCPPHPHAHTPQAIITPRSHPKPPLLPFAAMGAERLYTAPNYTVVCIISGYRQEASSPMITHLPGGRCPSR